MQVSDLFRVVSVGEKRSTAAGKNVITLRACCDRTRPDRDGKYGTDFLDLTFWDKKADLMEKHAKPGALFYVTGELITDEYETKDGVKKMGLKMTGQEIKFAGVKPSADGDAKPAAEKTPDPPEYGEYE